MLLPQWMTSLNVVNKIDFLFIYFFQKMNAAKMY